MEMNIINIIENLTPALINGIVIGAFIFLVYILVLVDIKSIWRKVMDKEIAYSGVADTTIKIPDSYPINIFMDHDVIVSIYIDSKDSHYIRFFLKKTGKWVKIYLPDEEFTKGTVFARFVYED